MLKTYMIITKSSKTLSAGRVQSHISSNEKSVHTPYKKNQTSKYSTEYEIRLKKYHSHQPPSKKINHFAVYSFKISYCEA